MNTTDKVMSWLEGLAEPDWRDFHSDSEVQNIAKSALELLKAQRETIDELISDDKALKLMEERQEAVKPEVEVLNEIDKLYRCPKCHKHFFYEKQKYCDQCGQAVKWNE